MYSINEFRDDIAKKITDLGIDPKFIENPAFTSILIEISSLISQMNMTAKEAKNIMVTEENGKLSFELRKENGDKYSMSISCGNNDEIRVLRTHERREVNLSSNGQVLKRKELIELVASVSDKGFITFDTHGAVVDNYECKERQCNNYVWAERKYYTPHGIMRDRDYKDYSGGKLDSSYDRADVGGILYIPRQAFDVGHYSEMYKTREILRREKLDVARFVYEDKTRNRHYQASVPLNQEHGLREMHTIGGDPFPKEIMIDPISSEELEEMITRENNPKVEEGLRVFAEGREKYYYNSNEDSHFKRENVDLEVEHDMARQ